MTITMPKIIMKLNIYILLSLLESVSEFNGVPLLVWRSSLNMLCLCVNFPERDDNKTTILHSLQ